MISVTVINVQQDLYFKCVRVKTCVSNNVRTETFESFFDFDEAKKPKAIQLFQWVIAAKQEAVGRFLSEFNEEGNQFDFIKAEQATEATDYAFTNPCIACEEAAPEVTPEPVKAPEAPKKPQPAPVKVVQEDKPELHSFTPDRKNGHKKKAPEKKKAEIIDTTASSVPDAKSDFMVAVEAPVALVSDTSGSNVATETKVPESPVTIFPEINESAALAPEAPVTPIIPLSSDWIPYDRTIKEHTSIMASVMEEFKATWHPEATADTAKLTKVKEFSLAMTGKPFLSKKGEVNMNFKNDVFLFIKSTFK